MNGEYESHVLKPRYRYVPEQIVLTRQNRDAHTNSIREQATKYLAAKRFTDVLKKHTEELTMNQYRALRYRALCGDPAGAFEELERLLFMAH